MKSEKQKINRSLNPNYEMAKAFLQALGQGDDVFTFQTFSDQKSTGGIFPKVLHGTLERHFDELARLNEAGAGIFVMVNKGDGIVHEGFKTCRTKASVTAVRAQFVDLDGAPLAPLMEAKRPPDIVVESSPGRWHGYWLGIDCPLDAFKSVQQALAQKFGGDIKVCDLPRVLRLPGFYHQKQEPFMTRTVTMPAAVGT